MESIYEALTVRAQDVHNRLVEGESRPHKYALIALAGPPGSGKSTIAAEVIHRLNTHSPSAFAIVLPMDGFHLPRSILRELPNSREAFERRGAAWTFDAEGVVGLVEKLRSTRSDHDATMYAPAFNHVEKDPVEDAIAITPEVNLIILEGNWLLYDVEPWRRISQLVDDTWFVDVDFDLARDRIIKRHLASGIESNWQQALVRAEGNDLKNGDEVREKLIKPGIVVRSVDNAEGGFEKKDFLTPFAPVSPTTVNI